MLCYIHGFISVALLLVGFPAASPAEFPTHIPDEGGRARIPELPAGEGVTVDGVTGDWSDLNALDLVFSTTSGLNVSGRMIIEHPDDLMKNEVLYLLFEVPGDATDDVSGSIDNQDRVIVYFDLSHDHATAEAGSYEESDDRGIQFTRGGDVQRVHRAGSGPGIPVQPGPPGLSIASEDSAASLPGGGWAIEMRLMPSDLGLNSFNALMGAAVRVIDESGGAAELWPSEAGPDPQTWINLITRPPFDYVLLLDQSGSMIGEKWDAAKRAANNFALILGQLNDAELNAEFGALGVPSDRLGLATFTWRDGFHTEGEALVDIGATPGDYTGEMDLSNARGTTPVLEGVNEAFEMFGLDELVSSPRARNRLILLMSDGKHNQPSTTYDLNTDLAYQPSSTAESALRVNPVAIGTDGNVDTDLLNELKSKYGFASADASVTEPFFYNIAEPDDQLTAQLTKFFVTTILPFYNLNIVKEQNGGTISDFYVRAGERNLLLFAFWDDSDDAAALTVVKPQADGSAGGDTETGELDTDLGYSYLKLADPPFGEYTNFTAPGADYLLVLLDLEVEARFGIDAQPHGTGSDIILRARLREKGQPITGADVRADEVRPEAGLGTLAATISLVDCEPHEPTLPPPPAQDPEPQDPEPQDTVIIIPVAPDVPLLRRQQIDPGSYRYQWAQRYVEVCGLGELPRTEESGLQLFDDGTHGDEAPGDGIYTRRLSNTRHEGSYVFRFTASGTASDGQPFHRIKEVAEYVFVDVDPGSSEVGSQVYSQTGTTIVREYYVIPRDRFGGYLGPSQREEVQFEVTGGSGEIVSDVLDRGRNGIYSVLVRYEEGQPEPEVTPVVQGEPIVPPPGGIRGAELGFYASGYRFDSALDLDAGYGLGGWIGIPLFSRSLYGELEFGSTLTNITEADTVRIIQLLGNLRADLHFFSIGPLTPHVTAGAGFVRFQGEGDDETVFAYHGGTGLSWFFSPSFGLRASGRVFRINEARGSSGVTTNVQIFVGLFLRVDP